MGEKEGMEKEEKKKRIAFFQLGDCGGDELEFLNLDERALDLLKRAELIQSILLGLRDEGPYDVALVEGAVASEEDVKNLREIRERSRVLIALGSCATLGGLPGLNRAMGEERVHHVYGNVRLKNPPIENLGPLDLYVKVDYHLHGCPVDREELFRLLEGILEDLEVRKGEKRFPFLKALSMGIPGSAVSLVQDRCILCGRCVEICSRVVSALGMANRGFQTTVTTPFSLNFDRSACISCGLCTVHCPAAAMVARDDSGRVEGLLSMRAKGNAKMDRKTTKGERVGKVEESLKAFVEVEAAVAIGEPFGLRGVQVGRLASALKLLGFEEVRLVSSRGKALRTENPLRPEGSGPIIVPCSEAARRLVLKDYPELAEKMVEAPRVEGARAVWIGPCTARKLDAEVPVLTTREIVRLIRSRMEFRELDEGEYETSGDFQTPIKARAVEGVPSIREELEKVLEGRCHAESLALFVCPEGCLSGGGQPPVDIDGMVERRSLYAELESLLAKAH